MPPRQFPPQRKIGIQTRSITGTMPDGNRYESSLERDLVELLQGEPDFESYHAQPVRVPVPGFPRPYTPDGLVFWNSGRRPLLLEVKHREDLVGEWRTLRRKFRAATGYAAERGWDFQVFTEDRIRSERLLTVRFLEGYRNRPIDSDLQREILEAVPPPSQHSTPAQILTELAARGIDKAAGLSCLWQLVATGTLSCDWDRPLNMSSPVWRRD